MPFTFSHPAAVLPATVLPKRFYSFTGLVVGSMAPDFEYFMRMEATSHYGHSISGIFWFDLIMGLFLAFLYHLLIRDVFIANLPKVFRERLSPFCQFKWTSYFKKNWLIVFISIIVGAATHILWDGFTHLDGLFVNHLPYLQHSIKMFGPFPVYNVLQHLSTLIGGVAILIYVLKLPKGEEIKPAVSTINYWISILLISLLIMFFKVLSGLRFYTYHEPIIVLITSLLIALTVTSYLFRYKTFLQLVK